MKITVTDWGDDAYKRTKKATGEASSEVIAEVEIERFSGFSFDGGRLDIQGHPETIWIMSHQWSLNVEATAANSKAGTANTQEGGE